jgi:tetratricopeptide (TPR) repeat protein
MRRHLAIAVALAIPALAAAQSPPTRALRPGADDQRALTEYQTGWAHMRSEQFEEALAAFSRALDLNPRLILAHYGKGRAYMALHRYQEAIASLATCRDDYLAEAGRKFVDQNDANRARQERLMELRDLQTQYNLAPQTAQNQDVQRQIENAMRQTNEAAARGATIDMDASVPAFVTLSLGSAYFRAERMDDAEREYKNTIKTDAKSGEAHNNLAVIYFLPGRHALAKEEIKAAEKVGFRVNPDLKQQVKEAEGS